MALHCACAILVSCIVLSTHGVQIGTTWYDSFAHPFGQRLFVDDSNQIHVNWLYSTDEYPGPRFIKWNFRFAHGAWYGEISASPSVSGHCQLDIMRGDPRPAKRTLNSWHYGGHAYISIDLGSGWGGWPGDTSSPHVDNHIWPCVACANNNNIILATGNSSSDADSLHLYLTTDEGETWTHIADFDSCTSLSQFVRASHNPGSQKVVHVWTQSIAMDFSGLLISQMACDVWYRLSTDNGVTWEAPIDITNYTHPGQMVNGDSTPWAYADVNAVFDNDDKLHIAWSANLGYMFNDTLYYGECAKIFHWDEVSDTITVVNGAWWNWPWSSWLPAYEPQLIADTEDGYLYCLWHGQTDTTDTSWAGLPNGDLYGAYSTDNGITWSQWVNLTNTHSPGAPPGECEDEVWMTANPCVVNDSIFITYIVDKDAGSAGYGQGMLTENPVYCWIFHKGLITGIEEEELLEPEFTLPLLKVYPNPFKQMTDIRYQIPSEVDSRQYSVGSIRIYDIAGCLVKDFSLPTVYYLLPTTIKWDGTDQSGHKLPAGVYFVKLTSKDKSLTEKIIKLR